MTINAAEQVKQIREKYPNPITALVADRYFFDQYCVGGAVFMYVLGEGLKLRFPKASALALALETFNRQLPEARRLYYASRCLVANDKGDFEAAWKWVEEAIGADL